MNKQKSITAAKILIAVFLVVLVLMLAAAPMVTRWYVQLRGVSAGVQTTILLCWYLCTVPAALALWRLWRILSRIGEGEPFDRRNVRDMITVSWCALACTVICGAGVFGYAPFILVVMAMLFLFIIVRVTAACFRAAADLAEENSLTI